jgi:hypothetical protein
MDVISPIRSKKKGGFVLRVHVMSVSSTIASFVYFRNAFQWHFVLGISTYSRIANFILICTAASQTQLNRRLKSNVIILNGLACVQLFFLRRQPISLVPKLPPIPRDPSKLRFKTGLLQWLLHQTFFLLPILLDVFILSKTGITQFYVPVPFASLFTSITNTRA